MIRWLIPAAACCSSKTDKFTQEQFKGEQTRQAFFKRIMNIQGALGGEAMTVFDLVKRI